MASCSSLSLILCLLYVEILLVASAPRHNYGDALTKSILFFEGQRSGKLPPTQRMKWRKDSALKDGKDVGVDLTGGYYDAGDNVKFSFPMAFTITTLAWSVIEFGSLMGADLVHANEAVKWGTDYFLKSTTIPNKVFMEAGDPDADHQCWERPEDMTTLRKTSFVDAKNPGSEVSAEIAAALAASSMVFRKSDPSYSKKLLDRAIQVYNFADTYRGSYNFLGRYVCPLYCDVSGYEDELLWAAAWIYKATNQKKYLDYVVHNFKDTSEVCEFGWDNKHAGIYVLMAIDALVKKGSDQDQFRNFADQFICKLLPESPTRGVTYSPGGLLYKDGPSNMQHVTALSFLAIVYARYLNIGGKVVHCGDKTATTGRIIQLAKSQVDYVLGDNPMKMSYMVGYGRKYPRFIHHRGSSLPSIDQHPKRIGCGEGYKYFHSSNPNYNDLVGALVGGPYPSPTDKYNDTRHIIELSEPTTYFNSPFVGLLAFFKVHHSVPESAVEVLKHVSSEFF